jgi:hypothetical protein
MRTKTFSQAERSEEEELAHIRDMYERLNAGLSLTVYEQQWLWQNLHAWLHYIKDVGHSEDREAFDADDRLVCELGSIDDWLPRCETCDGVGAVPVCAHHGPQASAPCPSCEGDGCGEWEGRDES